MEFLPVKYTIGKIPDPVAQADDPAVTGYADIKGEVTVSEQEVFDGRVPLQFFTGKLNLVLLILPMEGPDGPGFDSAFP